MARPEEAPPELRRQPQHGAPSPRELPSRGAPLRKPKRKRMLDLPPEKQEVRRKKRRSWLQACYSKYRQRKAEELARPQRLGAARRPSAAQRQAERARVAVRRQRRWPSRERWSGLQSHWRGPATVCSRRRPSKARRARTWRLFLT